MVESSYQFIKDIHQQANSSQKRNYFGTVSNFLKKIGVKGKQNFNETWKNSTNQQKNLVVQIYKNVVDEDNPNFESFQEELKTRIKELEEKKTDFEKLVDYYEDVESSVEEQKSHTDVINKTIQISQQFTQPVSVLQMDSINLIKLSGRLSQKHDLTGEQKQMLDNTLSNQTVLMKNLETINPNIIKETTDNQPKIEIAGKQIAVSLFNEGVDKLAKQISNLQGNLNKPLLKQYVTKKQPFVKVVKQEETTFKPTLNQLFQTRSVLC